MSTLTEIENAVSELPPPDIERLLLFAARTLGAARDELPEPRDIPLDKIQSWIEADEQEMREFHARK